MESEVIARMEAGNGADKTHPAEAPERKLELKICERCGGLWLRPAGSRWIYCRPCKIKVNDLPPVSLTPRGKRSRRGGSSLKPRTERVQ